MTDFFSAIEEKSVLRDSSVVSRMKIAPIAKLTRRDVLTGYAADGRAAFGMVVSSSMVGIVWTTSLTSLWKSYGGRWITSRDGSCS